MEGDEYYIDKIEDQLEFNMSEGKAMVVVGVEEELLDL